MEFESLIPGVQHGEHANGTADITGITREFDDRPGGGLHQRGVSVALMAAEHLAQLRGHGGRDVEVWHR